MHKDGSGRGGGEIGDVKGAMEEAGAVRSGLESVPLGDVSTRPSEHVFPVLHLRWSTLPRQVDLREGK